VIWGYVIEGYATRFGFAEGAGEGSAEVGRLGDEERGVDAEGGVFWAYIECDMLAFGFLGTTSLACCNNVPKLPSSCTSPRVWWRQVRENARRRWLGAVGHADAAC
jgi:hypothetical protein